MYRSRKRQSRRKMELMRKAKERKRIGNADGPQGIWVPPMVRRRIVVEDYDFGTARHEMVLYRSNRIDSYEVMVDGKMLDKKMGWSAVCTLLRLAFVRVGRCD